MYLRDYSNCGVPCFNLGTDDGRFLKAVVERAKAARRTHPYSTKTRDLDSCEDPALSSALPSLCRQRDSS